VIIQSITNTPRVYQQTYHKQQATKPTTMNTTTNNKLNFTTRLQAAELRNIFKQYKEKKSATRTNSASQKYFPTAQLLNTIHPLSSLTPSWLPKADLPPSVDSRTIPCHSYHILAATAQRLNLSISLTH
jgi:hypothetical protein